MKKFLFICCIGFISCNQPSGTSVVTNLSEPNTEIPEEAYKLNKEEIQRVLQSVEHKTNAHKETSVFSIHYHDDLTVELGTLHMYPNEEKNVLLTWERSLSLPEEDFIERSMVKIYYFPEKDLAYALQIEDGQTDNNRLNDIFYFDVANKFSEFN